MTGSTGPQDSDGFRGHRLALGIERVGLLPLRFPIATLIVFTAICIAAGFGITRIEVDDSLSQLFQSDTEEYRQFRQISEQFPSTEYDVLIVVEGEDLLARENLVGMRELVVDLQLLDGARGIISLFSARKPPVGLATPDPLFPETLPEGEEYDALVDSILTNEILRGKLLSEDGELALVVLSLEPETVRSRQLADTIAEIRETIDFDIGDLDLTARLSGVPVMQLEIRNAVERDRLLYNALGFAAGCLIAIVFFRRVSFMIVAAGPPLLAILVSLGLLGWLDYRLNMFLNVMTPLIMVISFSDSMQLTFAARDRLIAGMDRFAAFRSAILVVGPACVLTHATAGLSFVALQFSDSNLIRTFGEAGLIATIIALFTVLILVPLLGIFLVRNESALAAKLKISDAGVNALRRFCAWVASRMVARPGFYSLIGVLIVAGLSIVFAGLEPRYRLADQVPDKRQAVAASERLDVKLTGANPIDILVQLPEGQELFTDEALAVIHDVHTVVESQSGLGNVWSLDTLRTWLREKGNLTGTEILIDYVESLPIYLTRRFISEGSDAILIAARIPDKDASELLPVIEKMDGALEDIRKANPEYGIYVTGLSAIAARNSASMISRLKQALTIEIVFVAAFIGLAFRSFTVMLASILPGIFPIVLSGTLLLLLGEGLQFASVVALTVSFGLGLSATIHFLNRMRLEEAAAGDPAIAVEQATILVGPALILTSVVLACGLAMTALSDLPSLRMFGWLSAFSMMAALFADLFILRPVAMYLYRFRALPAAAAPAPAAEQEARISDE